VLSQRDGRGQSGGAQGVGGASRAEPRGGRGKSGGAEGVGGASRVEPRGGRGSFRGAEPGGVDPNQWEVSAAWPKGRSRLREPSGQQEAGAEAVR
jgi:hypothetical protein